MLINNDIFLEGEKIYTMGIFTKEMLINAGVTLAVVMVGLYVHDKFVAPKMRNCRLNDLFGQTGGMIGLPLNWVNRLDK